jgi:transposase
MAVWPAVDWRLGVQVVAIDPSAAFRKALGMSLPRTAVSVDHFHLISLANQAMTETRQNLSQQVKGRRGRAVDKAWAHRMLLLRGGDQLSARAARRHDLTGTLQSVWKVKEQLRVLLRTGSLEDAGAAKEVLEELVKAAGRPETNRHRSADHHRRHDIKRTARGYRNAANYKSVILLRSAIRTAA